MPITLTQLEEVYISIYVDGLPVGPRSDSSILTTNTLAEGSRVSVKSWTTSTATGNGCSSFSPEFFIGFNTNPVISLVSNAYSLTSTNSIFCQGDDITFTASSTSAISTYTFSLGGVTYQASSTNIFQPSLLTPPILVADGASVVVIGETPMVNCFINYINDRKCCFTRTDKIQAQLSVGEEPSSIINVFLLGSGVIVWLGGFN